MCRQRQQIDRQNPDVERQLARRLGRVAVKQDIPLAADAAYALDRLDDAGFVIHVHDADELCVFPQRRLESVEREQPVGVRIEPGDLEAVLLQRSECFRHRLVLGGHGDGMAAPVGAESGCTDDGEIVGLGGARCEHDAARFCAEQLGDRPPRMGDHGRSASPGEVRRRRITQRKLAAVAGVHRLDDLRIRRRRGRVIEIDHRIVAQLTHRHASVLRWTRASRAGC